tara:strand:- start:23094 stop:23567 length:474 start_codon:yes stop_codon:yes gene_type:complete
MSTEKLLHDYCTTHNITLSLAESCTGGNISSKLTKISGASDYFVGSIVCYTILVKNKALQIPVPYIEKYGVVSPEVARAMANGALQYFETDIALGITGYAGPNGGTLDFPVGSICVGVASKLNINQTYTTHFAGSRRDIIEQASEYALKTILQSIVK